MLHAEENDGRNVCQDMVYCDMPDINPLHWLPSFPTRWLTSQVVGPTTLGHADQPTSVGANSSGEGPSDEELEAYLDNRTEHPCFNES